MTLNDGNADSTPNIWETVQDSHAVTTDHWQKVIYVCIANDSDWHSWAWEYKRRSQGVTENSPWAVYCLPLVVSWCNLQVDRPLVTSFVRAVLQICTSSTGAEYQYWRAQCACVIGRIFTARRIARKVLCYGNYAWPPVCHTRALRQKINIIIIKCCTVW